MAFQGKKLINDPNGNPNSSIPLYAGGIVSRESHRISDSSVLIIA